MPDEIIRPREEVLFQQLHGEGVLLDTRTDHCFRLNTLGSRIWSQLQVGLAVPAIASEVAQEYDIALDRAEADVRAFLRGLQAQGLVTGDEQG